MADINTANENVTAVKGIYDLDLTVNAAPIWPGKYDAFCVENRTIGAPRVTSDNYTLYEIVDSSPLKNAAWLMDQYLGDTDTNHKAASLQVAIWEAIFDPENFNLSNENGNFYITSSWSTELANTYLSALSDETNLISFDTSAYRLVSDDGYGSNGTQDYIIHNPSVPIPAAAWLFGIGVIGMVGVRRKFRVVTDQGL